MLHLVDRSRLADDRLVRACAEADLDEIASHPRLYRTASDVNNVGQMLLNLVIAFWPQDEVERSAQTHDRQVACINELLADDTISRPERLREADDTEESHCVMHACALAYAPRWFPISTAKAPRSTSLTVATGRRFTMQSSTATTRCASRRDQGAHPACHSLWLSQAAPLLHRVIDARWRCVYSSWVRTSRAMGLR